MQKGTYSSLLKTPHPSKTAANARLLIALHELGKSDNLGDAAERMVNNKVTDEKERAVIALSSIQNNIQSIQSRPVLNNLYVHLTFQCNLECRHCYAEASSSRRSFMPPEDIDHLLREALDSKFRQVIITGGEPLVHPLRDRIFQRVSAYKNKGMNLVLRSNLTGEVTDSLLEVLGRGFDQIVVSIDGSRKTHDKRRGKETYDSAVANVSRYQELAMDREGWAELSLACVMNKSEVLGSAGKAVRELGESLGIKRLRFRPMLPLGRARVGRTGSRPEAVNSYIDALELIKAGVVPRTSCGLGKNLYIAPDGLAFPCYACGGDDFVLGNVFEKGLSSLIEGETFQVLRRCSVDSIEKCKTCEYRYLCGGMCRAWDPVKTPRELDSPPPECGDLKTRAQELLKAAYWFLQE
jgi:uncharacterized protein